MSVKEKIRIVLTLNETEFFSLNDRTEADLVEIRLDQFSPENGKGKLIADKIRSLDCSCVLTYRQAEDSSLSHLGIWTQEDVSPLIQFLDPERHYLDLELDKDNSIFTKLKGNAFGIVRSVHDFSGVPSYEELEFFLRPVLEEALGIEKSKLPFSRIFKIAALPKTPGQKESFISSCLRLKNLCAKQTNPVGFCGILMGEEGKEFRIFPERIGSDFTYSCLGEPKAPGQIDLQTLLRKRAEA